MHLEDAPDPLRPRAELVRHRVAVRDGDRGALLKDARVDAQEREAAHVLVRHDLEREGRERVLVHRHPLDLFLRARVDALDAADIRRGGQELDDRVDHRLHALVLERRTGDDRHDGEVQRSLTDRGVHLFGRDLLALQVLHREVVVDRTELVEKRLAVLVRPCDVLLGDVGLRPGLALVVLLVVDGGLHRDEIDVPEVVGLRPDGDLDRHGLRAEAILGAREHREEVRAEAVHLVHIDDARHLVLVHLAPDRLGLGLDAADRAEHAHRAVEHAQRALHLDREVDMAGRVDDVDLVLGLVLL